MRRTPSRPWPPCPPRRRQPHVSEKIVEKIVERVVAHARPREDARPPQGLHPEGRRRRPQGVSAHRRIRRRPPRRDLHRHAQGRRRLPRDDEQLRHRHLARPAIRRAARGIRGGLHLHALRAGGLRAGQRRASRTRPRSSTTCSASSRSPISPATTSPMSTRRKQAPPPSAQGEAQSKAPEPAPATAIVSRGFVRGNSDRLMLIPGGGQRHRHWSAPRVARLGANALKGELARPPQPSRRRSAKPKCPSSPSPPRRALHGRQARRGQDEGLCRRGLPRMRELHAGAERDVLEVRYLRSTTGCSVDYSECS